MQTPVQIDFQGMPVDEHMRESILDHVGKLEDRYGRVTSCRVVVRSPGGHHRTGGLYEIHIRLALPNGKEVEVGRTPQNDERYADKAFAINAAFKRARRQLQDQVRHLQGKVKTHEATPLAKVIRLDQDGGFGFLETEDGREIYFHRNSVLDGAFARLGVGTRVAFAEEMGEKGPQASTVRIAGKHGMR
jgi:cold shock CspA family protein